MSTLAVFLVLAGGSAFAATQLAKNSVGPKQLRKGAVTTAKIKNGAVGSTQIKDGAVGTGQLADGSITSVKLAAGAVASATHADTANSATHATTADSAVSALTAHNLDNLYVAVVTSDASLARGSSGVSVESVGSGLYRVLPPVPDTTKCVAVGSAGGAINGVSTPRIVSAAPSSDKKAFFVGTYNTTGAITAHDFSLIIRC